MSTTSDPADRSPETLRLAAVAEFPPGFEEAARRHERAERAFADAVFDAVGRGPVEYRLAAANGSIRATIRGADGRPLVPELIPLLPFGYLADVGDDEVGKDDGPAGGVLILRRRLGLVDLPRAPECSGLANLALLATTLPTRRRTLTALPATGDMTRSVPFAARMARAAALPRPEPARWLELLCEFGPASVTLTAAPIADLDRSAAADAYEALLGHDSAAAPRAGAVIEGRRAARAAKEAARRSRPGGPRLGASLFLARADGRRVTTTLNRLRRPAGELVELTMRVTAPSRAAARAIAAAWADAHGGALAYWASEVEPEARVDGVPPGGDGLARQLAARAAALGLVEPNPAEGPQVGRLTRLLEGAFTRAEFGSLFRLPVGPIPGLASGPPSVFVRSFTPPPPGVPVIDYGLLANPVTAAIDPADVRSDHPLLRKATIVSDPLSSLKGHGIISGLVGLGKSHLLDAILAQLMNAEIRVTIIDPSAAEHYRALSPKFPDLRRFTFVYPHAPGHNLDVARFDVMRMPRRIPVQLHLGNVATAFASLMGMHLSLLSFFMTGLRRYYTDADSPRACGLMNSDLGGPEAMRIRDGRVFPSLDTFREFFLDEYIPSTIGAAGNGQVTEEWRAYFTARLDDLWLGPIGQMCREADAIAVNHFGRDFDGRDMAEPDDTDLGCYDPFHEVADGNAVLEFESLGEDEKVGAMLFCVMYVSEHLLARYHDHQDDGQRVPFQHALVIEEAHNVAPNIPGGARGEVGGDDPRARLVTWITNALAEYRKRGLAVLFATQLPGRMAREVVELVDLIISFRTTPLRHRKFLANTIGASPAEAAYLARLGLGRAVIRSRYIQTPVLTIIPADGCGPFRDHRRRRKAR